MDEICATYRISGTPVVEADGTLVGIITNRDMRFEDDPSRPVGEVMTRMPLVTAPLVDLDRVVGLSDLLEREVRPERAGAGRVVQRGHWRLRGVRGEA